MQAALRGLFGGKAAKSSGSSGGNNATSDESADPTDVAPPLLTSVFGRPPSYTYAPVFRPQQVPPPGQPPQDNHTQAPGPQQLSPTGQPRQPVQQPLDSIPENAPVYPVANTFQSNTYKWHMNNQTFKTQYADSVSTFVPDAQPRKPHVDDEERASSSKASVGDAVRPPIERALKMQSRDVTGWQEAMKEQKRQRQDDDKIFVSMAVPLDERPPAPPRPSPIRPTSPMQAVMTDKNLGKPTCSLNLICYRPGSQGCVLRQVRVIDKQRFQHDVDYDEAVKQDPGIIESDKDFFDAIQTEYTAHMCGFWRRYFSLKTLRHIRLLSYTPTTRPEIVPLDEFTLQEVFHAYNNPATVTTDTSWISWVFRLRQRDRRHALEFVEGWSGTRIALIGSVPWVAATVVGIVWTLKGGDAQTAFTVAGFILTVGTSLLALLAIVSKIES